MSSQVETQAQGKQQATATQVQPVPGREPKETEHQKLEQLCINTIRTLAMDAVQKANSGHPGTPMALAPLAFTLFDRLFAVQSAQSALAGPRSLHPVERPCLACCCIHAAPHRLRSFARRPQAVSPVGFEDAWPSGVRLNSRSRNHDRSAGTGLRQLRRHGDRAEVAGVALRQRTCSITGSTPSAVTAT